MSVRLSAPNMLALAYICHRLRPEDAEECLNGAAATPDDLAAMTWRAHSDLCRIAWFEGAPVAMIGAAPLHPTRWVAYAFGTEQWDRVVLTLTKYARRVMAPELLARGVRRLECSSHERHTKAHGWLKRLGATPEGMQPAVGRDGSAYITFRWLSEDVRRP